MSDDPSTLRSLRRSAWRYLTVAAVLIGVGVGLAAFIQGSQGFSVRDVRFTGADGTV